MNRAPVDTTLRDLAELRGLLLASKDPKERVEIRKTIAEIKDPSSIRIVWVPPVRRPTALELYKRRFAKRLAEAMGRKGIPLTELSFRSGLPYDYLSRAAAGKAYPSHVAMLKMARALRTTIRFLES